MMSFLNQNLKITFNSWFQFSISRWHRIALSIKGDSVTLIIDCKVITSKLLNRTLTENLKFNKGMLYVLQDKAGSVSFSVSSLIDLKWI